MGMDNLTRRSVNSFWLSYTKINFSPDCVMVCADLVSSHFNDYNWLWLYLVPEKGLELDIWVSKLIFCPMAQNN